MKQPVRVERLLLVQFAAMGDVILCTPAIRAARRAFPNARIDFLTRPLGADALTGNPHLDEILVYRDSEHWQMIREIRRRRYDAVVDFHSYPRTAYVVALSGAKRRVGFRGRGPRNLAYTDLDSKERVLGSYIALRKVQMLELLGVDFGPDPDTSLEIAISDADRNWAERAWQQMGLIPGRQTVAISAVSREGFKNWGPERWARVADALADTGAQVLLTNGPGERDQAAAVVERMRHSPAWDHGPTSVRQLAALYERCALWVGNDGGPKHVAVAAGVPSITVIRWTMGTTWTDQRPGSPHRFFENAPADPCDFVCKDCSHRGCLEAVSPDGVLAAARAMLRPGALPVLPSIRSG